MLITQQKEFSSAEHEALGDIKLFGLDAGFSTFKLKNGANVSFGELILLAGDYFGMNLLPISLGASESARKKRFLTVFSTLDTYDQDKLKKLLTNIKEDTSTELMIKDQDGKYLMLAVHNIDHFGEYAVEAFKSGYALAMDAAVDAANLVDHEAQQEKLQYAYSLLGFAAHFLTDRFSSGHMRTPRLELDQMFSPEIGSLLSYFQHNEDNDMGLEVESANVDDKVASTWVAFGDEHLFDESNIECNVRARNAVQAAANELYRAFVTKVPTPVNESVVMGLIPHVTENNHPPMFKMDDNGNLLSRSSIDDVNCNEYRELTRSVVLEIMLSNMGRYIENWVKNKIEFVIEYLSPSPKSCQAKNISLYRASMFTKQTEVQSTIESENNSIKTHVP